MAQETKNKHNLSPEEEILELERKLEEKKRALSEQGTQAPAEKEIFREVLREHIKEARPSPQAESPTGQAPAVIHKFDDDLKKKAEELKQKEKREEQIRALIEFALTRSIQDAVKIAEEATPWYLDELHDYLVDDYYDKLIQLRKIKPL